MSLISPKKNLKKNFFKDSFLINRILLILEKFLKIHIKNQIEDNALDQQLEQEDLNLLQDKSNNTLEWLYQNQEEENDVYRQKYDELELEFKNILSRQLLSSNLVAESFISI